MGWDEARKMGWQELPLGGLIPVAGNTEKYQTGGWRTFRPILDLAKCTDCAICWYYCLDSAVVFEAQLMLGFHLAHCKGCGVCAAVCPPRVAAITMIEEGDAEQQYGAEGRVTPDAKTAAKAGGPRKPPAE
jgi:pyruvate ferredoxin oxidoreductase delta subunit